MSDLEYIEYIDPSFDGKLKSRLYPWLPWIGKNYKISNVKTLILGESTYNWSTTEEDRIKTSKRIKKNNHLRLLHVRHAMKPSRKSGFVRNIEKAIFQKKNPDHSKIKELWLQVSYHNLVLRPMATNKHRPSFADYSEGWKVFLNLLDISGPEQCICYGLEYRKIKALRDILKEQDVKYTYSKVDSKISRSNPKIIKIHLNNKPDVKILFIRHPSAYFSWKKWGAVINKELKF